jgi:hypothetical protein
MNGIHLAGKVFVTKLTEKDGAAELPRVHLPGFDLETKHYKTLPQLHRCRVTGAHGRALIRQRRLTLRRASAAPGKSRVGAWGGWSSNRRWRCRCRV